MRRLGFLASALSYRQVRVEPAAQGERSWTDGKVIYLDADKSVPEQLESLVVQSSLLAAGSLDYDIVRALMRRPALSQRYLAVEAQRALATIEPRLPPSMQALLQPRGDNPPSSPSASLALARERTDIADPPASYGTIRARQLLEVMRQASQTRGRGSRAVPKQALVELADDAVTDETGDDLFANPSGGGGIIGKWLAKLLRSVRQLQGGGVPGADAPTHWSRSGLRGRGRSVHFKAGSDALSGPAEEGAQGTKYPEWDVHAGRYRQHWCTVHETAPRSGKEATPFAVPDRHRLRRALARLGLGIDRFHRSSHGDEIDIDAVVESRIDAMAGTAPDDDVFINSVRRRRDLSVLLLLDISGSAAEAAGNGKSVHDLQRAAAAALLLALHELGDRVALYAFYSQGRSAVHLQPVKRFGDDVGAQVMQRLSGLTPSAYSRLGAAIRHGATILQDHGGTPRQVLVVLSDGLAYDHGYEPSYGAADAKRALVEARRDGVGCLCLSVGASTDTEALRRVFGSAAHACLPAPEQLSDFIGQLFRSAMRSAEVRRRVS